MRRRRLAALLVEFRERAGRSPEEAAERIGCHRSKINRIENARLGISLGELRDLLKFYGIEDPADVDHMVSLARRMREPAWIQRAGLARPTYPDFIEYERTADRIRSYQSNLIAGLLQTPEYAREVISAAPSFLKHEDVEALIEARMKRQEILDRPDAPRLCVIESEAALRIEVGGRGVMRRQLEHLETMAGHPSVEVQVIPNEAGAHIGLTGSFVLLAFPSPWFPDVVCLEQRTGTVFLEHPDDAAEYAHIFESLRSTALSPKDSLDMIARVRQEL
ncbi:XRE family transcriptional regulator [Streptomyces ipomoeae]|nr:XRE family transcriptional regulator [Streptomyces ipomoeae]